MTESKPRLTFVVQELSDSQVVVTTTLPSGEKAQRIGFDVAECIESIKAEIAKGA